MNPIPEKTIVEHKSGYFDRLTVMIVMYCISKLNEDKSATEVVLDPSYFSGVIGKKLTAKKLYDSALPLILFPEMQYKSGKYDVWEHVVCSVSYTPGECVYVRVGRDAYDKLISEINFFKQFINK